MNLRVMAALRLHLGVCSPYEEVFYFVSPYPSRVIRRGAIIMRCVPAAIAEGISLPEERRPKVAEALVIWVALWSVLVVVR